jgi:hypothetical protein
LRFFLTTGCDIAVESPGRRKTGGEAETERTGDRELEATGHFVADAA